MRDGSPVADGYGSCRHSKDGGRRGTTLTMVTDSPCGTFTMPQVSRGLEPIPVGYFDDILMAKILCHRSLCDEYRPRESTS
jgi:hypothetical protein